jgi:multidrug efflux pump
VRLSDISIERPVLATVMNLLIVVVGLAAFAALPVREYPDVDPPVVSVSTVYPGAAAETVESTITEPLEQVLNGIEGMRTIESTSGFGLSSINLEFDAGRDVDVASVDVSNAIQRGLGDLPLEAERPIVAKAGSNAQALMWLNVKGEAFTASDRTDLADRLVKAPLQVLPGVARIQIGGGRRYAMRVWLDPVEMAARGVDASDVRRAIRENNLQAAAGELEGGARKFTIRVDGQIDDPRVYENLVVRMSGDATVRIRDIGRVELGSENYNAITRFSRKPTVGVGIIRQSRSNELAVSRVVRETMPAVKAALPEGVDFDVAVDNTLFVEASLAEVWETLAIALVLVVLVNLIFLRSLTTTTITAISIPVSLVGSFAAMQALDFSVNVLTLLALVLAIGLLVDDSIVVLENIYRRMEHGEGPLRAALNGSREVGFAVVATTVSVIAVLIPLAFMSGNIGRLFREFALTMAISVAISMFVSLTLVPMLCSRFLNLGAAHGRVYEAIERSLRGLTDGYRAALDWCLVHRRQIGIGLALCIVGTLVLFRVLPETLVPTEDRGTFMTFIRAPQGSTAAYTDRALGKIEERIQAVPEVAGFFSAVALGQGRAPDPSAAIVFTRLKPWHDRERSQQSIVQQLFGEFMQVPDALAFPVNPPSLGQSRSSDIHVILRSSSATLEDFDQLTQSLLGKLRQMPELVNVDSDLRFDNPQLDVRFDRERAADLGVPVSAVAESLQMLVSQGPADEFVMRNKQYDVVMALAPRYRSEPEQLGNVHVRAANGAMVPLSTLVEVRPKIGASVLNHHGLQRSASVTANLVPGAALGDVLPRVRAMVSAELPAGFTTALGGLSREFDESSGAVMVTFGVALIIIYLVLAAQFESFVHPLTVMLSVPLACLGALATLFATGNTLNLYSQIGIILLVGLVTKNAILLVDFANQERARGAPLEKALREAGRTRFRPIVMTSATAILGAVPLAIASGAGAEGRRAIGAVVVGGLLFSTIFTVVVIPVVHRWITLAAERAGLNTVPPRVELDLEPETPAKA